MVNLARSIVRSAPIAAAFVICLWAGDADAVVGACTEY